MARNVMSLPIFSVESRAKHDCQPYIMLTNHGMCMKWSSPKRRDSLQRRIYLQYNKVSYIA